MKLGVKLTGLLCAGSAVAQVSSISPGGETPQQASSHAIGLALLALALPVLGFLLSRAISQNDNSIKELGGKIDKVLEAQGKQTTDIALLQQDHKTVKDEVIGLRDWKHDFINKYLPFLVRAASK